MHKWGGDRKEKGRRKNPVKRKYGGNKGIQYIVVFWGLLCVIDTIYRGARKEGKKGGRGREKGRSPGVRYV